MKLPRFYNARFLLSLPFAMVANACADYLARADEKAASAINRPGVDDQ